MTLGNHIAHKNIADLKPFQQLNRRDVVSYGTEQLAARLKAAREAKGLSQRKLSVLAGVPQSHISKIENDAVDLRVSSLSSIAHPLDALASRASSANIDNLQRRIREITQIQSQIDPDILQKVQ